MRKTKRSQLIKAISDQLGWIAKCGGNLSGYIAKYDTQENVDYLGERAIAIYNADIAQLGKLEKELTAIRK